jgi:hypothetical protein
MPLVIDFGAFILISRRTSGNGMAGEPCACRLCHVRTVTLLALGSKPKKGRTPRF